MLAAVDAPAGALRRLAVGAERVRPGRASSTGCSRSGPTPTTTWRDLIEGRVLTGRGAARIRRVARTLADLDDSPEITAAHLESAALLRSDAP